LKKDVQVKIAGIAGDGSFITGEILASAFKKIGFYVVTIKDFPSNIRGLPSNYTIRGSEEPVYGRKDFDDFLIAFNIDSIKEHLKDLNTGSVCIYDSPTKEDVLPEELRKKGVIYIPLPLRKIAREKFKMELIKNMVAFGAVSEFFSIEQEITDYVINKHFGKKGEKIVSLNKQAVKEGKEYIKNYLKEKKLKDYSLYKSEDPGRILAMGNELVSMGAVCAGCRFVAAYPITPASEIVEFLSKEIPKFGGVAVQAEDEISAINMAIGASYAGARAMTASSGPGISLKTEAISYAGMTETPIVIYYAQRVGPATGLPTKTEQGDILYAIFAGHGEFPRIILTPALPEELFYLTAEVFNLAEKFQVPVIIMTDQFLAQNKFTLEKDALDPLKVKIDRGKLVKDKEKAPHMNGYGLRYKINGDGISERLIPGIEGIVFGTTGFEHDEAGYGTEEEEIRVKMVKKRMSKIPNIKREVPPPCFHGEKNSNIGIISFGSTFGPIMESIKKLKEKNINISFLRIVTMWPFPQEEIRKFVEQKDKVFIVEQNYKGQLRFLVENAIIDVHKKKIEGITKYSGRPFKPKEIIEKIEKSLKEVK
jgi:2-oxoglutarate ferredoxin oxidoreductase subunit alpha